MLWNSIPKDVRDEIDGNAEARVCGRYGEMHSGKVLSFSRYLAKHSDFLDRTVENRCAIRGETQWKSDHRFIQGHTWSGRLGPVLSDSFEGKECVDGMGVLMAYWWAIMKKACGLRWEDRRCEADEELAADRDEAWNLVNRAIGQMFGQIGIMTREELLEKSLEARTPGRRFWARFRRCRYRRAGSAESAHTRSQTETGYPSFHLKQRFNSPAVDPLTSHALQSLAAS